MRLKWKKWAWYSSDSIIEREKGRGREGVGRETEKREVTRDQSWFFSKMVSGWKDIIPKDPRKELEGQGGGGSRD